MIKTTDILPQSALPCYYTGKGKAVYLDQFGIREIDVEEKLTISLVQGVSETELNAARKKMDQLLPGADEEWLVNAGLGMTGLFRFSKL